MAQVAVPRDRRSVTILFADIVGSTAMIEGADVERAHRLLAPVVSEMAEIVERYSGHVSEVQGDGLLAIFGAPRAIEHHPLQACRAALAIQNRMTSRVAGSRQAEQVRLQVRIGLSSGVVVVTVEGEGPSARCHALGIPVHLASRIQTQTPPGEIGLSRYVHERVAHAFDTSFLGDFQLKGISDAQPIYVLGRAKASAPATASRPMDAPFVGRARELQALIEHLSRLSAGQGGAVLIEGEPGIGKSRLLSQARARATSEVGWLGSHCSSHEQGIGYRPFVDMLRSWLGIAAGSAATWDSFAARMSACLDADGEPATVYLATLLGIEVPSPWDERVRYLAPNVLGNHVRGAVRRFLLRQAQARPCVLALEDLHWADESSASLLQHLIPLAREAPVLFVVTSRLEGRFTARLLSTFRQLTGTTASHVVLGPLDGGESRALVELYLGAGPKTRYWREHVLARTGGNAFFIEELIHNIKASGLATESVDGNLLHGPAIDAVPETIQEIILARVDRLKADTRQLLVRAAVIGREFVERVLAAMDDDDAWIGRRLRELEHHQFIREAARTPELAYVFCHALTQQTVYESILLETRKRLHRRVAEALDRFYAGRRAQIASTLAFHYARADAGEKALTYLLAAAGEAEKISADAEAVRYYEEALQTYETLAEPPADWQHAFIRRRLGLLHWRRGNLERAESYFLSALRLYGDRFPSPGILTRVALVRELALHVLSRLRRSAPLAIEDSTDRATEQHMRTYEGLAWLMLQTDQDRMLYATLRVLNLSARSQWRESAAKALGAVGFAFDVLGLHGLAQPYHRRALMAAGSGDDLAARALVTDLYGGHCLYIGDWDRASDSFDSARTIARRIGDLDTWASATAWQCVLLCERGELAQVQVLSEELLTVARETGFGVAARWGRLFQGAYLARAGRTAEAQASLREALEAATACGDAVTQVDAYGELGMLALSGGRPETARAYLRLGQQLIIQRRIRIQSIVPIYVGLADVAVRAQQATGRTGRASLWQMKRRCTRALATARRYSVGSVWALRVFARHQWLRGNSRSAQRSWQEAMDAADRLKARYQCALTLIERGTATSDLGLVHDGKELLQRCTAGLAVPASSQKVPG